jgi:hypothetical protein
MLHWGGLLGAIALAILLPARGLVPAAAVGPVILLLLALAYFLAGVHLDPAFRWVGQSGHRSPHAGLVQPRSGQCLLYDPRPHRHDFAVFGNDANGYGHRA